MNLWAESDNPELVSTPLQQAQKSGTGVGTRLIASSNANAILPALRAWLLADYVAPYCRSLAAARIFRRCIWLDALGGTRPTPKRAGESQAPAGGRDASHPYIFDDLVQTAQQTRNGSRPNKAAKKAQSEILPPALQAVAALAGDLARESKPITLQGLALDTSKVGKVDNSFVLPEESSALTPVGARPRPRSYRLLSKPPQFSCSILLRLQNHPHLT